MNAALQQLLSLARRSPLMVTSLALLVLLGVANYFLWDQQHTLAEQHQEVRHNGESMLTALTNHNRIIAQFASVQEALAYIDKNLVTETDLAENLNYFYQMETISRVRLSQLNQLSSQPPSEGNPYKAIPFSLRASGTFAQIMSFLHALETGPRLLRIKTFSFNRGDAKKNLLSMDLTVELLGNP